MIRDVKYAQRGGLSVAYQVVGAGGPDLVFLPGFVSHLDLAWEEPMFARFLRGTAEFSRLIWFDRSGTGLSDPVPEPSSSDDAVEDTRAVLDAVGSKQTVLFGVAVGAAISTLFALRYPERVRSLVLWGAHARLLRDLDYPAGWTEEFFESVLTGVDENWATGYGIDAMNPSLAGDERFRSWFVRHARAAASPAQARELFHFCASTDLRPLLPGVTVPTLLLHRTQDPWLSVEHSRYVASQIPGARLIEFKGSDHWPWIGDGDAVLTEVEAFLTGMRRRRSSRCWGPDALTRRERTIADLAIHGLSARDIGERLGISERTVETHIANLYAKLGVRSRPELVRVADHLR